MWMKPFICNGAGSTPSEVLNKALYSPGRRAKARGTSFSIALANELGDEGFTPKQIDTTVTVTMEDVPGGWTMTQIHLDVIATVPQAPQCDFNDAAMRAKLSCPRLNGERTQPGRRSGTERRLKQ